MTSDTANLDGDLELVIVPRTSDLGDNFEIKRALPSKQRRMVGPFVFLDQMGPHQFLTGKGLDVRPHPHIGLATVTYLFTGEILHRDSLGTVQPIQPGAVNWMTAGCGIVHSERTSPTVREHPSEIFGLQSWVALPKSHEETTPAFLHIEADALPTLEGEGISARIVAGSFFGKRSPVPTLSDLFYVDVKLAPGATVQVSAEHEERAIYVIENNVRISSDGVFEAGRLLVLRPGKEVVVSAGQTGARVMLLGGEPMDGPRAIVWNFVSSSLDRLEQAKADWKAQRFPKVPGETEFIPLPDLPGRPVFFPS
jgi:redox-sensitive bicupin YhaK (pirin superfamily)